MRWRPLTSYPQVKTPYRVIVMDSRGHGRTTRNVQPYGYDLMASDVLD